LLSAISNYRIRIIDKAKKTIALKGFPEIRAIRPTEINGRVRNKAVYLLEGLFPVKRRMINARKIRCQIMAR
jgi:hypothetical protein